MAGHPGEDTEGDIVWSDTRRSGNDASATVVGGLMECSALQLLMKVKNVPS